MIKKLLILSILSITSISQAEQSDTAQENDETEIEQTASLATTSGIAVSTSEFLDTTSELLDKYVVQPVKTYTQTPSEETKEAESLVTESSEDIQASVEETKKIEPSLGSFEDYYGENYSWVNFIPFYGAYLSHKEDKFIDNTGKMHNLPILRNGDNSKKEFFKKTKDKFKEDSDFEKVENINLLKTLIEKAQKHPTESNLLNACVFSFQIKDYKAAIELGNQAKFKLKDSSFVDYVIACSYLYADNLDIEASLSLLEKSLSKSPENNPIIGLCFVIYLDRFIPLMREGKATVADYEKLIEIARNLGYSEEQKLQSEEILAMLYLQLGLEIHKLDTEISKAIAPKFSGKKDSIFDLWDKYKLRNEMIICAEGYYKNLKLENKESSKKIERYKLNIDEIKENKIKKELIIYSLKEYRLYIITIVIAVLVAFAMLCRKIFKANKTKELILTN